MLVKESRDSFSVRMLYRIIQDDDVNGIHFQEPESATEVGPRLHLFLFDTARRRSTWNVRFQCRQP